MKKIEIPIGTRASLQEFTRVYRSRYLEEHDLKLRGGMLHTVKTKYGELVVENWHILTYLGNNMWDAREE